MGDGVHLCQLDHPTGQQTQCPPRVPRRWRAARRRDEVRLGGTVELAWLGWASSPRRRVTASSSPPSTYRSRTRSTVARLTSSASQIRASIHPGPFSLWSALSKIRACSTALVAALPVVLTSCRCVRSASLNLTTKNFRMAAVGCRVPHQRGNNRLTEY